MNYYVSKTGCDINPGTKEAPFLTINKAASVAWPGDVVTVSEGIYREWVNPAHPGTHTAPIVYQAEEGEHVVITGSEEVTGWTEQDGIWTVSVPNSAFGARHPYQERVWGDWKMDFGPPDRIAHTGGVYLDGKSLKEVFSLDEAKNAPMLCWYAQVTPAETVFYCNFQGADPNESLTEYVVRPNVFWPEKTNMDYITVRGFEMRHAATNWAPPTALQEGLIGPHWSKGWVIENNVIHDTMCVGVSLGKDITSGHNEWSRMFYKEGTQRERESIFRALHRDWDKRYIGSHTVRNNTIYNCEQAGIVGHLGCVFSTIEHNHIYNVNMGNVIAGAETAGIKLHAAIDVTIKNNFIHDCCQGIWLDWQAQGTRVTGNVFHHNRQQDTYVEISQGPTLIDHNLMLSGNVGFNQSAQGVAFVHNLCAGRITVMVDNGRHTPYHFPHETAVMGLTTVPGGDDRYYNNIFIRLEEPNDPEHDGPQKLEMKFPGPEMDGAPKMVQVLYPTGLSIYDDYPGPDDKPWLDENGNGVTFGGRKDNRWPIAVGSNAYFHRAIPWNRETDAVRTEAMGITFHAEGDCVELCYEDASILQPGCTGIITSDTLGISVTAETKWDDPDGRDYIFDRDMLGNARASRPTAGPIELASLKDGKIRIKY